MGPTLPRTQSERALARSDWASYYPVQMSRVPADLLLDDRRVDLRRCEVVAGEERTRLSPIEARLLGYLAARAGEVVPRDDLWREVWGGEPSSESRAIDATARRLRRKLEPDPARPRHLISVYGEGYRLDLPTPAPRSVAARAAPSAHARAPNLPPAPTPLLGRDDAMGKLDALMEARHQLVTLTGPGGVGKTSLALALAHAVADRCPGGVWFADLATATGAADVVERIAAALEQRLSESDGPGELAQLGAALAARGDTLVVLDNADGVVAAAGGHIGALRVLAPGTRFLVTARSRLELPGERVVRVPPLAGPAAVALFEERSRDLTPPGVPPHDGATLHALVERLDRLPLAIELAAARTALLTPAQLLERLTARFELLRDPLGRRTSRHASIGAALDVSWELLSPMDQAALAQCAVLHGAFPIEAAEAVVALDAGAPVLDAIHRLVEHSLVVLVPGPDRPRLRLLDSTREYAAARLAERGASAVRDAVERHARAFGEWARVAIQAIRLSGDAGELRAIGLEADNYRAVAGGAPSAAAVWAALALATWNELHGRFDPAVAAGERALAAADQLGDPRLVAEALLGRAATRYAFGCDLDEGRRQVRRALDLARDLGDDGLVGRALLHLTACDFGDRAVEPLLREALARFRAQDIGVGEARALAFLGYHRTVTGDPAAAAQCNGEALGIFARLGASRGHVIAKLSRAALLLDDERPDQAWAEVVAAREMSAAIGYRLGEANATSLSAIAAMERGDYARARRLFEEELPLRSAAGNSWYLMFSRAYQGLCGLGEGRLEAGLEDLDAALAIAIERDEGDFGVRIRVFRALLLRHLEPERARAAVEAARDAAGDAPAPHLAALVALAASTLGVGVPAAWDPGAHRDLDVRLARRFLARPRG